MSQNYFAVKKHTITDKCFGIYRIAIKEFFQAYQIKIQILSPNMAVKSFPVCCALLELIGLRVQTRSKYVSFK